MQDLQFTIFLYIIYIIFCIVWMAVCTAWMVYGSKTARQHWICQQRTH